MFACYVESVQFRKLCLGQCMLCVSSSLTPQAAMENHCLLCDPATHLKQ